MDTEMLTHVSKLQTHIRYELVADKSLVRVVSLPDLESLERAVGLFDMLLARRPQVKRELISFGTPTTMLEGRLVGEGLGILPALQGQRAQLVVMERPRIRAPPVPRPRIRVHKIMVIGSRMVRQRTVEFFGGRDTGFDRRRLRASVRLARLGYDDTESIWVGLNDDAEDEANIFEDVEEIEEDEEGETLPLSVNMARQPRRELSRLEQRILRSRQARREQLQKSLRIQQMRRGSIFTRQGLLRLKLIITEWMSYFTFLLTTCLERLLGQSFMEFFNYTL